jgi:glycosyltransferase involved in cell wall biosynthesis
MSAPLRILQVSTLERIGGAANVAWSLHRAYLDRGHASFMAVGSRQSDDPSVFRIGRAPPHTSATGPRRLLFRLAARLDAPVRAGGIARGIAKASLFFAQPPGTADLRLGKAEHYHPGSWAVDQLPPEQPDVVHVHNLHGRYYDLRALPALAARRPVVATLHDAWLLSGHCAHSFGCERWVTGCGECPDLSIPPAMEKDRTAFAWRLKRDVLRRTRLAVVTPSRWLMARVERSIVAPAMSLSRVIPNGVDLSTFRPGDRGAARARLGLDPDARIVLLAANGIRDSAFKDFRTLREAVGRAAEALRSDEVVFLALGEDAPPDRIGRASIRFVPYTSERHLVAAYYAAADVYAHAARAETFPSTVLEALACGLPVVASAVGGVPEQLRDLAEAKDRATGILVAPEDPAALAAALGAVLRDAALRARLGENAARDAHERFGLARQADAYLELYREAISRRCAAPLRLRP